MRLEQLLQQPQALPTVPELALKLIETIDQEAVNTRDLAHLISGDPVLLAKLLKQANSAFFGLARKVTTAQDAVAMLGFAQVRALVLGNIMDNSFSTVSGVRLEQFWRYSFNTANMARYVASQIEIDLNTAFTVGVVHSIGELVMHVGMPQDMEAMDAVVAPLAIRRAEVEFATFGYTYADVGAALAHDWKFPPSIVNAIAHQRAPFGGEVYEPMAGVIHMAAWRARAAELRHTRIDMIHTYPDEVGELLQLDPDLLMEDFQGVLET
ncbi:MAG: hypothetical protein RLZZ401_172 [Pseudomonadota bacterium]|jgi:HD-like signal output (HDOD) protein